MRSRMRSIGRLSALALVAVAVSDCGSFDTTRQKTVLTTLGDDMFGLFCDRVGAQAFQEDLTGASYRPICHVDASGTYGNDVDLSGLPTPKTATAKDARRIAIAKMQALATRRSDLVRAFNALFPDVMIDDITKPGKQIRLHDALLAFGQNIVPLYEINPYDPKGDALTPATTRALGNLFDSLAKTESAKEMLAEMWGRQGYRPFQAGLGVVRATLGYPGLRNFTTGSLGVLGPNGSASTQLQQVLGVGEQEMLWAKADVEPLKPLAYMGAPTVDQLNRPRSNIEFLRDMFLSTDPRFAVSTSDPVRPIAMRDRRGYVIPSGNQPGVVGTVQAPFVDMDNDGFADVDASGRFVDASGAPLDVARPFAIPGVDPTPADPYGRPDPSLYSYIDTSRTLAGDLTRVLEPLVDATQYATPGDPNAFQSESETLMYAIAGANVLLGPRAPAEYDFDQGKVVPVGTGCPSCLDYSRFQGEASPLVDLVHAAGQLMGDKDSDALLLGLIDLLQNHEQDVARLVGAALKVKAISDDYDAQVAAGKMPPATLAYEVPIWDEVAQIVNRISNKQGLMTALVATLGDDTIVTPVGGAMGLGDAMAAFATYSDRYTYDPQNLNGPCINLSVGSPSTSDPLTPINYNAPRNGDNRSILETSTMIIHDARHVVACNKDNAKIHANVAGISATWPLVGSGYNECELFQFNDLAAAYLDTLLPMNHPKRTLMDLKPASVQDLLSFLGNFVSVDQLLNDSSLIDGLTLHPEPNALNRLVFFGAPSDKWGMLPDYDSLNDPNANGPYSQTSTFVAGLMEPAGAVQCPIDGSGVPQCTDQNDLMRLKDKALFTLERLGFHQYLAPVVTAFAGASCDSYTQPVSCTQDYFGESMLTDMFDVFYAHFPGKDHGPECTTSGKYGDPSYCSGAGLNHYEPIIAQAAASDLIPALHEFSKAAATLSKITIARGPMAGQTMTGAQVLELTTRILFSQDYAMKAGMVDRTGNHTTTWVDGTPQSQLTTYTLFADGLHKIDTTFAAAGSDGQLRQAMWKRARSQLVDALVSVEGTGTSAHFKNPGTAPLLIAILKMAREQVNANCPNRESGTPCTWATKDLGQKLADQISNPMFAGLVDMMEAVRQDETARRELERYLTYLLQSAQNGDAFQATLASMTDVMQVLSDDTKLTPIIQAAAVAAAPENGASTGCADRTIAVLKALTDDQYDKYHVMDHVLPNLVTPIDDGGPTALTPLELIMDSIADIDRLDPSVTDPLAPDDYGAIMGVVRDFMTDKQRGLEQIYFIIDNRPRK